MKETIQQCMLYCKELKILYVEDNPQARTFTLEMLKRFFNDITVAEDGEDGLEKFKNSTFDLVLTDINMPKMNGLEMLQEIRNIDSSTIVLILSAHNETEYFMSSIELGVDGFLLKPLRLEQFANTLVKVLEKLHLKKKIVQYQKQLEESNIDLEIKVEERTSELEYRLYHDSLTNLKNYEAMQRDIKTEDKDTVLLIDINGFQKFNDLYGINAGNTILKMFAEKLKKFKEGKNYSLYRVYADVFALLNTLDNDDEGIIQEDIKELFQSSKSCKIYLEEIDGKIEIESTIGISIEEKDALIKADMALNHAKKMNKSIEVYTQEIDTSKQLAEDLYWKEQIQVAIDNSDIIPVFQGIVDKNGKVIKYESLMRLVQRNEGKAKLISPFFFLEASIKTRQYDKLTRIMVQKSFSIMSKQDVDFSINLSFEDLADPTRVQFLHNEIEKYGVGKQLIMEVLESEVVSDYEMVIDVLQGFREHGVRIAIDDFGSGFSNFEHILQLNPDYIKIDASLIKNVLTDHKSFTLVKAISEFSKELGMKVIAEFVSSKDIFETLKELSIDEYQGFYFSVPSQSLEITRDA